MSDNNNNIPEYNQQPNGYIVASTLPPPPNGYYIPQNTTPVPANYPPNLEPQPYYIHNPQVTAQPTQYYMPQSAPAFYYANPADSQHQYTEHVVSGFGVSPKERICSKEYDLDYSRYMDEAWNLFKQHWIAFVLYTILYLGVQFIPYVGGLFMVALSIGYFVAGTHAIRTGPRGGWYSGHLFHGVYFFFPIVLIGIIYSLIIMGGLLLCIIPGLYFMVVFGFSTYVYIEFRQEGVGIVDAFSISRRQIVKNFWQVVGLFLVVMLVTLLGVLAFGVGVFVSIPVGSLMLVFAFRDMFGLSEERTVDTSCYCC